MTTLLVILLHVCPDVKSTITRMGSIGGGISRRSRLSQSVYPLPFLHSSSYAEYIT